MIEGLLGGSQTEPAVIAVHLLISAISFALLVFFVRGAKVAEAVTGAESADAGDDPVESGSPAKHGAASTSAEHRE